MNTVVLTPAYGRDFSSAKSAEEAFHSNADFITQPDGQYASKQNLVEYTNFTHAEIRFSKLTKLVIVEINS